MSERATAYELDVSAELVGLVQEEVLAYVGEYSMPELTKRHELLAQTIYIISSINASVDLPLQVSMAIDAVRNRLRGPDVALTIKDGYINLKARSDQTINLLNTSAETTLRILRENLSDDEEMARQFVRKYPDLTAVLRAMVVMARENEIGPTGQLGEFCRAWIAAREPTTPHTLTMFVRSGLIQESPRGVGSGRKFYVLTNCAAIERVLEAGW